MNKGANSVEDAAEALRKDAEDRRAAADKEIRDVLAKYSCRLDVQVVLRENSVAPKITVVAL